MSSTKLIARLLRIFINDDKNYQYIRLDDEVDAEEKVAEGCVTFHIQSLLKVVPISRFKRFDFPPREI